MGEVRLLDCTLGAGGTLNQWRYGEALIPNFQSLLSKSGAEIIEIGLLRSENKGPHYTIYDSTKLPSVFERKPGQIYGLLLSENRPDICTVPVRNEQTVDIIRVCISSKQSQTEWEYYAQLKEKGYQVAVLISETAQYDKEELSVLLNQVNAIRPCTCYIYDGSGVLREEELEEIFAQYDQLLAPEIAIGFHGCSNLMPAIELLKVFCGMETARELWIDASVAGMGTGALHLDTGIAAKWMNVSLKKDYSLPVLDYLEEMLSPYVDPQKGAGAKLLYHATAENRCSYRYAEYYSNDLSIDVSDQVEIFKEISQEDAFHFSKQAANRALMAYRKKKLNMVIVIPTANRAMSIDALLFSAAKDLLRYGIDIVIYDSSEDEKTHAVTMNFQLDGYDNVCYKRYTGPYDGFSIDEKVMSAYREHLDYDYIWACRDGLIPTLGEFYNDLLSAIKDNTDYIVVDSLLRNDYRYCYKKYTDCLEFFNDNAVRTTILGSIIFRSTAIKRILDRHPLDQSNYCFWTPIAPFHEIALGPFCAVLIVSAVFNYNLCGPAKSFWSKNILKVWAECWYNDVLELPAVYRPAISSALQVQMSDFHPFNLKSLLSLRASGGFSLTVYKEYKEILFKLSNTSAWKFYFAAIIPKGLAWFAVSISRYADLHPARFFSRCVHKLYDIYVRLGR